MSVEIVPGEMRLWTDRGSALRPAAGGKTALALLEALAPAEGATVLVLGPHGDDVVGALAGRPVTVLVRSLPDAEAIDAAHAAEVVCGDLAAFAKHAGGRRWDLVVALDGLERVASNDWPTPPWGERFALLGPLLAENGTLVLAADNPASALALADARPLAERRETGDWEPPAHLDPTRPRTVADLPAGTVYGTAWTPSAPAVLAVPDAAGDLRVRAALGRGLTALAERELLLDPLPYVEQQIAAGRFADVATSWVVVTGAAGLPPVLLASGALAGPAPGGELVSDRAVALAQAEDVTGLRALVRAYLPQATALPDATVLDGDRFTALESGSDPGAAARWLARRLLAPDLRRIWPRWVDAERLAGTLAATAGVSLGPGTADEPVFPVLESDLRSVRAVNEALREELAAMRGELFAQRRLIEARDRQLERRTNRVHDAEVRAARAEAVAETHARSLVRRGLRAIRHPRRALAAVKRRLGR